MTTIYHPYSWSALLAILLYRDTVVIDLENGNMVAHKRKSTIMSNDSNVERSRKDNLSRNNKPRINKIHDRGL